MTTTQETSKRLKLDIIGSALLFWGGFVVALVGGQQQPYPPWAPLGSLAALAGLGWYIVTRLRIWWHHK